MTAPSAGAPRGHMPVPRSWRGYQRAWLGADVAACVTLLVIAVPEQLATSRLAGMPPITGLYAFVAGTVAFAVLGANPQMSVGADSTIAPLFAAGIARFAPMGSVRYQQLVGQLAVAVGVMLALVAILRLGWIAEFLSVPIIVGFLAGVAVIIVVHQLPDLLGLSASTGSTVHRLADVGRHLGHVNGWSLGIGAAVFAIVMGAERVDRRLPGALVGLVVSSAVVAAAHLQSHGVAVLGHVAHHAPHLGLGGLSWSSLGQVLPVAGVVALVVISQSAVTTRAFPEEGYEPDVGRDFLGVGAGNVVSGLFGSFAVNASPARTAAVSAAGGRTQVSGLLAAAAVVVLVPAAGLLTDVPLATLAAVLVFIATRIFHLGQLVSVLRYDRVEFGLAVVTLLTVAFVGVEQGIGVAVGLAILDRTRRSARPPMLQLGRVPGTTSWAPLGHHERPATVPGVVVVQFMAPLYYANAAHFRAEVHAALHEASPPASLLVLDADAMSDIDYTGARAVAALLDELRHAHVEVAMARAEGDVPHALKRAGLLEKFGSDRVFHTVDEAVTECAPEARG
ncbi:MAG TPA: SulP family inorganic anion transporter [Acidimicrobiales bacterium]|nr:SulP family inorganic anion transporter [Acidimicrobiales bacterium]